VGTQYMAECARCHAPFKVRAGGGFQFELLHCDECGKELSIGYHQLGKTAARWIMGTRIEGASELAKRYCPSLTDSQVARLRPLTRRGFVVAVNRLAGTCKCGGYFRTSAGPRCPKCRTRWTPRSPGHPMAKYD
jgi:hypothetical protein